MIRNGLWPDGEYTSCEWTPIEDVTKLTAPQLRDHQTFRVQCFAIFYCRLLDLLPLHSLHPQHHEQWRIN